MINLKEKKITSKSVFKGRFLDVRSDKVMLPNGKYSTREWIKHPGAVCIIPILPNDKIALIKQYRYPIQKIMIELPAGKLDSNERSEICAARELEEEIGYKANKLTFITNIHPAIGFADEIMGLYLAEDLQKTICNTDPDEFLELMPTELQHAIEMVWDGSITDVKTIIGILWAERLIN